MENYLSKLTEPYVGEVKVPDFNQIKQNALATAFAEGQLQNQQYELGGRQAYDRSLQERGGNALAALGDVTAGGFGAYAQGKRGPVLQNALANLDLEGKARETAMKLLQAGDTEEDKNAILDGWEQSTGQRVPQEWRQMPMSQLKQKSFVMLTTPETRQRMALAQNADQRAASQDARAANQDAREQELQPGKVALQGAQANYYGARTDRAEQPKTIMVEQPDPTDWTGKRKLKVPHMMQQNEDGSYALVPVQQGQQPQAQPGGQGQTSQQGAQGSKSDALNQARAAIAKGADRNAVIARLKDFGLTDDEIMQGVR